LHSLTGIVPIGAFLVEHFISNAFATNGPRAYADQVKFLTGLPFTFLLELCFIYIPLAYHAAYGIYIWYRGEGNVGDYPWTGNWLYTSQRWTGIIALIYMGYHTYTMRFTGVHLFHGGYIHAYEKVHNELMAPWIVAFYAIGIIAASCHFGYGIWLFAAKWGITVGKEARRKFGYVCGLIAVVFILTGVISLITFLRPQSDWPPSEQPESHAEQVQPAQPHS
jgi:succinate dehydrogenase / fumarate reductase cytochrome b subunit